MNNYWDDMINLETAIQNINLLDTIETEKLIFLSNINSLKKANISLDRKILSELATNHPNSFKVIVETTKK